MKKASITFRCDEDLKRALEIISALEGKTPSDVISGQVNTYISSYIKQNPNIAELLKSKGISV